MSYRSIKRVLGETSLERKCRFLFGACLLLLITASFWWYGSQTEKIVNEQNRNTGRLLVDQEMQVRHWKSVGRQDEKFEAVGAEAVGVVQQAAVRGAVHPAQSARRRTDEPRDDFSPDDDFELDERQAVPGNERRERPSDPDEFAERMSEDGNEYYYYQPIRATEQVVLHGVPSARRQRSPASTRSAAARDGQFRRPRPRAT